MDPAGETQKSGPIEPNAGQPAPAALRLALPKDIFGVSTAVVVGLLAPALAYVFGYRYEVGFAEARGIPEALIRIQPESIVAAMLLLLALAGMGVLIWGGLQFVFWRWLPNHQNKAGVIHWTIFGSLMVLASPSWILAGLFAVMVVLTTRFPGRARSFC